MNLTLRIWRQKNTAAAGRFVIYQVKEVTPDMSFLEMLDVLNEDLIGRGEPPTGDPFEDGWAPRIGPGCRAGAGGCAS